MDSKKKETIHAMPDGQSSADVYDDGNIPHEDLQNVIPDEVPRKDGPGGENGE